MIHCYECGLFLWKPFWNLHICHCCFRLSIEWRVILLVFIFMNFTVSMEVCYSSNMLVCEECGGHHSSHMIVCELLIQVSEHGGYHST